MLRRLIPLALLLAGCAHQTGAVVAPIPRVATTHNGSTPSPIQHVIIITMENRSFDHLFGTFPGANGIPTSPPCAPDPATGQCVYPFHDPNPSNHGGPHDSKAEQTDLDGGKMDGFIVSAERSKFKDPNPDEVMAYHTQSDIPTYWSLAQQYTLADNFFAATTSWSNMAHLYLVSAWSASCTTGPLTCKSNNGVSYKNNPTYWWTDITYILHKHGVSWGYFVYPKYGAGIGPRSDMDDDDEGAYIPNSSFDTLDDWNPLPAFPDVKEDGEFANIQDGSTFLADAQAGTLPTVSWLIPPYHSSDHPTVTLLAGQAWVQQQISAVENGPDWSSSVIFLNWDEWGGFYDHVVPPVVDGLGYGFRTPLIIISPHAKTGYIDHQLLSTDAILKFIEDSYCNGESINWLDGRPDSRPDVREHYPGLGDLRNDLTN
ncbi:MAG TPA: alkaline phosphatase family protein [Candidatus Eremiobacteraceae bacterium]|jgi:phospholipase C